MSDLTPELAEKLLAANLRNIVKKIGDGGTLTTAETEMMELAKARNMLPEEVHHARQAALLRKQLKGHKLSIDEQAELGVIPSTQTVAKQATTQTYKLTLAEYVERLIAAGMEPSKDPARKLKYWIESGRYDKDGKQREQPDLPPFDEPDQLAAWWRRNMTYRPPEWMVKLEKEAAHEAPDTKAAAADAASASGSGATPPPKSDPQLGEYGEIMLDDDVAGDFTVKILASAVRDSLARYEEARRAGNWKLVRAIREELIEDGEKLQRAQVNALKVLAGKGDYLRRVETQQEINRLLGMMDISFFNALEEGLRQANPRLAREKRRDIALNLRDRCFEHFHASAFAEAWVPRFHEIYDVELRDGILQFIEARKADPQAARLLALIEQEQPKQAAA